MSWTSRFANLGRFSPFTRSPPTGSSIVTDNDYSYITDDDLRQHQIDQDTGPPRDTDVLRLRSKRKEYVLHLPAYSIAKDEITIGDLRSQIARKTGLGDVRSLNLVSKGRTLKDDKLTCRQAGLWHESEILCASADSSPSGEGSDDDGDEEDDAAGENAGAGDVGTEGGKRRRNRGKKSKRRNKREERDATAAQANSTTQLPTPPKPNAPKTAIEKLDELETTLHTFDAGVHAFLGSPPADEEKRKYQHKQLSESILMQVLLKLDAVDIDGNPEARVRRKQLVTDTQKILESIDAKVNA